MPRPRKINAIDDTAEISEEIESVEVVEVVETIEEVKPSSVKEIKKDPCTGCAYNNPTFRVQCGSCINNKKGA